MSGEEYCRFFVWCRRSVYAVARNKSVCAQIAIVCLSLPEWSSLKTTLHWVKTWKRVFTITGMNQTAGIRQYATAAASIYKNKAWNQILSCLKIKQNPELCSNITYIIMQRICDVVRFLNKCFNTVKVYYVLFEPTMSKKNTTSTVLI